MESKYQTQKSIIVEILKSYKVGRINLEDVLVIQHRSVFFINGHPVSIRGSNQSLRIDEIPQTFFTSAASYYDQNEKSFCVLLYNDDITTDEEVVRLTH
jgi:hypothetical protein